MSENKPLRNWEDKFAVFFFFFFSKRKMKLFFVLAQFESSLMSQKNLKGFVLSIGHVDSCVESCQMCVIRRSWHGHTPRAPGIHVAQLVSELLQAVGGKVIVVI